MESLFFQTIPNGNVLVASGHRDSRRDVFTATIAEK